jgi:predicted RNA binding protein YcfA (HicA-like mRNA interferase family)
LPKLKPVSQRELIKKLRKLGFDGPEMGGKHLYMTKGNFTLTIPNPHKEDIGVDLLLRILRRAGISRQEWLSA